MCQVVVRKSGHSSMALRARHEDDEVFDTVIKCSNVTRGFRLTEPGATLFLMEDATQPMDILY